MTRMASGKKKHLVFSPLDESGKPVDWWFIYKIPKLVKEVGTTGATGYEYLYYDPTIGKAVQSPHQLTDEAGALDNTLDAVFKNPAATTGWILYNDEMPKQAGHEDKGSYGHTKGVIVFNTETKTAFWLLHSWPKFADLKDADLPTPEYGQTFLCISLDLATANAIANQMINHQEPQVYLPRVPSTLSKSDPLYLITQNVEPNAPGDCDVISCTSRGGLKFKVLAKNRKWGKDFWNDFVGPALKADMDIESWIRGKIPPILDSDGHYKTFDVKYIDLNPLGLPFSWPETHDHAKWGITTKKDWICVGDINRMVSQEKRGGGTIAFQDKKLWNALKKTDKLVTPPGHKLKDAKKLIKSTHPASPRAKPNADVTTKQRRKK
jgi:deoxyribonuclease-2